VTAARTAVLYRPARLADVPAITTLINEFAAERIMLPKTLESVTLGVDDFIVATDRHARVLGCAAVKEYSPSLAEVASVAVVRQAHGLGIGTELVRRVEDLASRRGVSDLFAFTATPRFFEGLGYGVVDSALFPEKASRDCAVCPRRMCCDEICVYRALDQLVATARVRAAA
jgi:N-acetylglutamate synthase-like GNAT family acetyltransferase